MYGIKDYFLSTMPTAFLLNQMLTLKCLYSMKVKGSQSCLTFCNPIDYRVHGSLQARMLEWVAFPFSRGSSQPRDPTGVSCTAGGFSTSWATMEAYIVCHSLIKALLLKHIKTHFLASVTIFPRNKIRTLMPGSQTASINYVGCVCKGVSGWD